MLTNRYCVEVLGDITTEIKRKGGSNGYVGGIAGKGSTTG
jgi:hypothetical protein